MSFKLKPSDSFWLDVAVRSPDSEDVLKVKFKHASRSEFRKLMDLQVDEVVAQIVLDWQADEPFTAERFAQARDDMPWLDLSIWRAFAKGLQGAREKN
jgi:hypothetical protein